MTQADAAAAGISLKVETRDGEQVLDFHSLRGTFATLPDSLDITLKGRQELMRHSDPRLTLNRYTRAKLHDLGAVVEKLPKLSAAPDREPERAVLRATGTDDGCSSDAVPDAGAGGSGRLRLRSDEESEGSEADADDEQAAKKKPLQLQGFEEGREPLTISECGEGGILFWASYKLRPTPLLRRQARPPQCFVADQLCAAVIGDSQEWSG
jgi:hypothetical protein